MKFEDFLSNKTAVTVLKRAAAEENALRHAYLLQGAAGTGKKTLVQTFAAALLCRGEEKPCGECIPCKKLAKGIHPDVLVLEKPKGKTAIPVETIRDDLQNFLYIKPNEAEYKLILIPHAEDMNLNSANALLKMLEEPPAYAVFLLTCDNSALLPSTIASRCVCLELQELSTHQVEKYLTAHYPDLSARQIEEAVLYGGGNLGRSIRYLTDETAKESFEKTNGFLSAAARSEYEAAILLSELEKDRDGFLSFLGDLEVLVGSKASAAATGGMGLSALDKGNNLTPKQAAALHTAVVEARRRLKMNGAIGLTAMWFCSQAAKAF